jgi:hypothetical protein
VKLDPSVDAHPKGGNQFVIHIHESPAKMLSQQGAHKALPRGAKTDEGDSGFHLAGWLLSSVARLQIFGEYTGATPGCRNTKDS